VLVFTPLKVLLSFYLFSAWVLAITFPEHYNQN
jgi:hypothetical protein